MGLFEHVQIMLDKKLLGWKTFDEILGYRLDSILVNKIIVEAKLIREGDNGKEFLRMMTKARKSIQT